MKQNEIFRKVSLDRLSSPEQLDSLSRVTTPAGWLALLTFGALITMALVWGWFGNIPVIVRGDGMLLNRGGIMNVVTLGAGQVTEILVKPNDIIRPGDIVARIAQPVSRNELSNARKELAELKVQHGKLLEFSNKDLKYQLDSFIAQKEGINHSIKSLESRLEFVKVQINNMQPLLVDGILTAAQVEEKRKEMSSFYEQIETNKVRLGDIRVQEHAYKNRITGSIRQSEFKINSLERNIALMEQRLEFDSAVISKVAGKVLEVKTSPGSVVSIGTQVISVEIAEKKLEVAIYVPESEGKKIKPGMAIDIVPSSVKKEESGSIRGQVTFVSEYPATYAGILTVLGNEQLVQGLLKKGAPYAVHADLIIDSTSPSGYKWSSGKGPAISVHSGTVCSGEINIENKRPLNLVIPYLKKSLGI